MISILSALDTLASNVEAAVADSNGEQDMLDALAGATAQIVAALES